MGNFSDKISQLIIDRKITVDEVVFGAEISRNAFFKYKNGTRLPASADIAKRIANTLCLNRDEYENLIEAYLIDSIGEYKFRGMRAVERFLMTPVETMYKSDTVFPATDISMMSTHTIVRGKVPIIMQIYAMIREGITRGDVFIFETVPERDIFAAIQQANIGVQGRCNKIEHIMAINESDRSNISDTLYGIESLEKLIITMSRCENYFPFYYYASLSTLRIMDDLFNNFVIAKDYVLCYSGNLKQAMFYRDPSICKVYRDIIENRRKKAEPFVEKVDFLRGFKIFQEYYQYAGECYIFDPGMCISAIVEKGDTFLLTNARHDVDGVTEIIKGFMKYAESYQNKIPENRNKHHYIVPKTMIRYNLREGYFGEFPRELTIPFSKDQMRMLLRRFKKFAQNNDVRLLNDDRFPESNTVEVSATSQSALISIVLPNEMDIRFFLIKESGIAGLIYEYLKHLYDDEGETGTARSEWFEEMLEKMTVSQHSLFTFGREK